MFNFNKRAASEANLKVGSSVSETTLVSFCGDLIPNQILKYLQTSRSLVGFID